MPRKTPPGPTGKAIVGSLPDFQKDPIATLLQGAQKYGDIVLFKFATHPYYFLRHPDNIGHVMQVNHKNYGKQTIGWKTLKIIVGEGLLTSEGDFWLRQRRIAQPAFHRDRIAGFGATMTEAAAETLKDWEAPAKAGEALNIHEEMMRLTLKIVVKTLLGSEISKKMEKEVGEALSFAVEEITDRYTKPYLHLPMKIPTRHNLKLRQAVATLDKVVMGIIEKRRKEKSEGGDLLTMLMNAKDEVTGESMDNQQLRDEVMTIFLAGHETTANALTWALYLLSTHPAVTRRLEAELKEVLAGRLPSLADFPRLSYTRSVIQETLRLYPPAWFMARSVTNDDTIGGYTIPKGSFVILSPYVTHRHPKFWENPEGFDPDRFMNDGAKNMPRFAYFPFGGGARQCIGNDFAMMEAVLILAAIAQNYRLYLVPGHPVELEPVVTLRPKHGMLMTAHPARPA